MTSSRLADPRLPSQNAVDEAAEWLAETADGELDFERRQAFSGWLRRSPDNIAAYIEVAAFWSDLPDGAPAGGFDIAKLLAAAQAEQNVVAIDQLRSAPLAVTSSWSRSRRLAMAAAILLAVGATTWGIQLFRGQTYATNIGEQRSWTLADGSTVELNARTRLSVRMNNEQERTVILEEGQALFRVAKDPERPFVVHSGAIKVQAIGTTFDVDRRSSQTTVTVLEGVVAVGAAPDVPPVELPAGQQVIVRGEQIAPPAVIDVSATTAWTDRRLVFQGTPLGEVVEDFNRFSRRPLVVEGTEIAALQISGVYATTDPKSLIQFLREQPGVRVEESTSRVLITSE